MKPVLMVLASLVLLVMVFLSGVVVTAKFIADPEPHRLANVDAPDLWTPRPKQVDTAAQSHQRLPDTTSATESAAAKPIVVDVGQSNQPANQSQNIPAVADATVDNTVTAAIGPKQHSVASVTTQAPAAPIPPASNNFGTSVPPMDSAQAEWCFARYKSYRVEDNTYQPYDGSPRRQCQGAAQGAAGAPAMAVSQPFKLNPQNVAAVPAVRNPAYDRPHEGMQPVPPEDIPYSAEDERVYDGGPDYAAQHAAGTGAAGSHEEWCAGRYRSYRACDNSYQPFEGGPRQQCQSPFG